jgi:histidine triad (HIT) family protein
MAMMEKNIFLDIVDGKIPAKIAHDDEWTLAFHDLNPQAPIHVLIIPKKEIRTHVDVGPDDVERLGRMHLTANLVAEKLGIHDFRLVINSGVGAGQTVPHLHMHLLAGRPLTWPPG